MSLPQDTLDELEFVVGTTEAVAEILTAFGSYQKSVSLQKELKESSDRLAMDTTDLMHKTRKAAEVLWELLTEKNAAPVLKWRQYFAARRAPGYLEEIRKAEEDGYETPGLPSGYTLHEYTVEQLDADIDALERIRVLLNQKDLHTKGKPGPPEHLDGQILACAVAKILHANGTTPTGYERGPFYRVMELLLEKNPTRVVSVALKVFRSNYLRNSPEK